MNYKEIGTRIRKYRKLKNISQEELAEKIDISTTHMSHIETGSTKLSLQVLVDIAQILEVSTDALIFEKTSKLKIQKIETILSDCNENEIAFITKIVETSKEFFEKESK
ncbi:MAG: helix-turn-helix transcriptional regulator [Spirochaetia bacterium]|jgi:transcriptional regulator with XRE-family HTH domain|nr:helix-turn-helix transcriptional regulator [Spirochaetia bacterium]MDY4526259.1 helix-turn-helix transcriptional regulator [Treponema sp.]